MAHFLRGQRFENDGQVDEACRQFFASKEPAWYRRGIEQLAERWRRTIDHNDYIGKIELLCISDCSEIKFTVKKRTNFLITLILAA